MQIFYLECLIEMYSAKRRIFIMKVNSVSSFNFKSVKSNVYKSEAQQLREHMEKTGAASKPVKYGAAAGIILGAAVGIIGQIKAPQINRAKILFDAALYGGAGITAGKIIYYLNKIRTKDSN